MSWVYLWKKQYDKAVFEGERAITLDPNEAESYAFLGFTLTLGEQPEEGIGLIEKAMRLNPRYPAVYLVWLANGYYPTGRREEAIAALKRAVSLNPNLLGAHLSLASIYSELGQAAAAQAEVAEVLRINPKFSLEVHKQRAPIKDPTMLERHLAALRKAGLK